MRLAPSECGLAGLRPVVSARGVSHVFGQGANARRVLSDIDLTVARGEVVLLMGPSGCGKTTILTLVAGLRAVQTGELTTLGLPLAGAGEPTRLRVRRGIGFIYQSNNLHESLTARENVRMGLEVHGPDALVDWRARTDAALADVGLEAWASAYPAKLSGGQKQRVAVARALVARPALVLADEPTAALDRATGRQVVDLMRDLAKRQDSAILMVTHDNRILDIADRILEMEDGRVVQTRSPPSHGVTT